MATILADSFDVTGSSLGAGWTEDAGSFQVTGSMVRSSAVGLLHASVDASSQVNQYVQCWCQVPNADQNAGINWRYQSPTMFYAAIGTTTQVLFWRRDGGGYNAIGTYPSSGLGSANWRRLGVQMVGSQIDFYLEGGYNTVLEGPALRITDANITGAGKCGIASTGNNASGANGPLWDGFHCCDGAAMTIYADVNNTGQTLGTASDGDGALSFGLNHVGLQRGSTLHILTEGSTPIGNGSGTYEIGHAGRFAVAGGESFPSYDDDDGGEGSANNANLIIQGCASGTRTLLRETFNTSFFRLRNDASYIMFRGFDWDCTGGSTSALLAVVATNNLGASTEHSFAVDKCGIQLGTASHDDQVAVSVTHDADDVYLRYNVLTVRAGRQGDSLLKLGATGDVIGTVQCRRNIIGGILRRGFLCIDGPASGKSWTFDHNTYYGVSASGITASCLEIDNGATVTGSITHKNSVMFGGTVYGTRVRSATGAISGGITAHHNGYFGLAMNRSNGVTDGGNEEDSTDPAFLDTGSSFPWPQSAASPAITVPWDLRPGAAAYRNSSDDNFGGIVLDRGALETYAAGVDESSIFIEDQAAITANPMSIKSRMIYPEGLDVDSEVQRIYTLVEQKDATFTDSLRCISRKADSSFGSITGQWKTVAKGLLDRFAYPFYAEAFQFQVTGNNTPIFVAVKFYPKETK